MKVVINKCYGGFGLSHEAVVKYAHLSGLTLISEQRESSVIQYNYYIASENGKNEFFHDSLIARNDPNLIKVIEQLGPLASGRFSKLNIVEIPDDIEWSVEEYDGNEWVAEKHRIWS